MARELADTTGETITQAVVSALRERLERERDPARIGIVERVGRLARDVGELPVQDIQPSTTSSPTTRLVGRRQCLGRRHVGCSRHLLEEPGAVEWPFAVGGPVLCSGGDFSAAGFVELRAG